MVLTNTNYTNCTNFWSSEGKPSLLGVCRATRMDKVNVSFQMTIIAMIALFENKGFILLDELLKAAFKIHQTKSNLSSVRNYHFHYS